MACVVMRSYIDLTLTPNSEAPGISRRSLDDLEDILSGEQLENARLLVTELVTNSVTHVSAVPGDAIRLRVTAPSGMLRVEVTDAGFWKPAPKDYSQPPDGVSGWGLYLVDRLSERWGVSGDEHTCVWFEIARGV